MQNTILLFFEALLLTGIIWYTVFFLREKKLLDRLQNMVDNAATGSLQRSDISESKFSALENSLKKYLNDSQIVTENRLHQKEMIQSLISDISHQTLTPISNIKLYTELLMENTNEHREEIETIHEQTEKLNFLIQSLVKLSRMENGIIKVQPQETPIQKLFDTLYQEFSAKAFEKHISLNICPSRFSAVFDLKWTGEAVGNILDNAIKYSSPGSLISVTSEKYSFFIRLDITDNGIGIEQNEINRIFSRFYRSPEVSSEPGTGIGLFLSREIIQMQKGYIKVNSKKGTGSRFSIFLPIIS